MNEQLKGAKGNIEVGHGAGDVKRVLRVEVARLRCAENRELYWIFQLNEINEALPTRKSQEKIHSQSGQRDTYRRVESR